MKRREDGDFLYKCRRCGEIDDSTHSPCLVTDLIFLTLDNTTHSKGIPVHMLGIHNCKDGHVGISDLIGGKLAEEGED